MIQLALPPGKFAGGGDIDDWGGELTPHTNFSKVGSRDRYKP